MRSTFSNEDPDRYWSFGAHPNPHPAAGSSVDSLEEKSLSHLLKLFEKFVPHLHGSFVCSQDWWEQHRGTPEAHMFRNLLFRAMDDVLWIFNDATADPAQVVQFNLIEANSKAERVWNDANKSFSLRKIECGRIVRGVLRMNQVPESAVEKAVPSSIGKGLSRIFDKYYGENIYLIGRTTEEAYEVQDRYGEEVVELLGTVGAEYESRAITRVQTVYGVSSMPLLCKSSVSAMWQLCQSPFYKKQISLLHKWIEPFAESAELHSAGCDYISSLHKFLRPHPNKRNGLFAEFYSSVLEWSMELYLLALLDAYVGPKPVVAEQARMQLLQDSEEEMVRKAIEDSAKGKVLYDGLYSAWLSYSALDFSDPPPALVSAVNEGTLQRALFDLMLGQRVKSFKLNRYSEVHIVRNWIKDFFTRQCVHMRPMPDREKLWWDGINSYQTSHSRWVSVELKEKGSLFSVLERWISDSDHLQQQLSTFEATTLVVNNPMDENRVFSQTIAQAAMNWIQFQADILDRRRRDEFEGVSAQVKAECQRLGLFTSRLPQFSQLFFYDLHDWEVYPNGGQLTPASDSRRAAKAYIQSRTRLESTCGISAVWYLYVEKNLSLFDDHPDSLPPFEPAPPHQPRPLGPDKARLMFDTFPWSKHHSRPRPRKKMLVSGPPPHSEGDSQHVEGDPLHGEDGSQRNEEEGSEKQQVDSIAGEEDSDYSELWPSDPAFTEALFKMELPVPTVPVPPLVVTDNFVSSSVPEERELQIQTRTPLSSPPYHHRRHSNPTYHLSGGPYRRCSVTEDEEFQITPRDIKRVPGHITYGADLSTGFMDLRDLRDVAAESGSSESSEEKDQAEDDEATESTSHQVTSESDKEESMDDVDQADDEEATESPSHQVTSESDEEEDIDDVDCTSNSYTTASSEATKAEKRKALHLLMEKRLAKRART